MNNKFISLQTAWQKYLNFERFSREKDGDLCSFILEWEVKMAEAQSAGCNYSDLVLALKLIEKANLADDWVGHLLSACRSTYDDSCLLSHIISWMKSDCRQSFPDAHGPMEDLSSHYTVMSDFCKKEEDHTAVKLEDGDKNNNIYPKNTNVCNSMLMQNQGDRSAMPDKYDASRLCPICNYNLKPHSDDLSCPGCVDIEAALSGTLSGHPSLQEGQVLLPRCLHCSKSMVPQPDACGRNNFACLQCGITSGDDCMAKTINPAQRPSVIKPVINYSGNLSHREREIQQVELITIVTGQASNNGNSLSDIDLDVPTCSNIKLENCGNETLSTFKCSLCDTMFKCADSLKAHQSQHESLGSTESPLLADNAWFNIDQMSSSDDPYFNCILCEVGFSHSNGLIMHFDLHHPDKKLQDNSEIFFKCDTCAKIFYSTKAHRAHQEGDSACLPSKDWDKLEVPSPKSPHENRNESVIVFPTRGDAASSDSEKLKKDVSYKRLVNSQMKNDTGTGKKPKRPAEKKARVSCEVCGKVLSVASIKVHMALHYNSSSDHVCSVCFKPFPTQQRLKAHSEIHSTIRNYACSFCNKTFKTKSTLNEHLNLHTRKVTYECVFCKKSFLSHNSVRLHIRAHHTGEKPYKCDHCHLSFYTSSKKMDHVRTHTGERPFSCELCGKQFKDSRTCRRHLKNVHGKTKQESK